MVDGNAKRKAVLSGEVLVVFTALCVRSAYLLRRPLWFDEMYTLWISRKPVPAALSALRSDSEAPLFYLLERPFVLLGELIRRDSIARLLPFIALAILFTMNRPKRHSAGVRFVLLLATSPLIFFYSGEARNYALLAFLSFCLFLAIFRSQGGRRSFWAAAALSAALPMIHYLGGLVLAGAALLSTARRRWIPLAGQFLGGSVFLLWLPTALGQPREALGWSRESAVTSSIGFLEKIGFWGTQSGYFTAARFGVPAAGALLGALLLGGTAAAAFKNRRTMDALLFALLPMLLAGIVGIRRPIFFSGRTEMATFPVMLWAVAHASRKSPMVRHLSCLAAALGSATILSSLAWIPAPPPYAVTAKTVSDRAAVGDLTIGGESEFLPLALAAERGDLKGRLMGVPATLETHLGRFETGLLPGFAAEAPRLSDAIERTAPGSTIRLAFPPDPAFRTLVSKLVRKGGTRLLRVPGGYPILEISR